MTDQHREMISSDGKKHYIGEMMLIENKTNDKMWLLHGQGRLLSYPYLYIGNWVEGEKKGEFKIYYQSNCQYGELFDFEKHRQGQFREQRVLCENIDPLHCHFELLHIKIF